MKAAQRVYKRAREEVLAAQAALADAAGAHDLTVRPPREGEEDPFLAEREALQLALEALAAAEAPIADEVAAAWQRNGEKVQAAKGACEQAIRAALVVEKEVSEAVMKRRLGPWPAGSPLVTEVEQARLTDAKQAMDDAIAANQAAEARFKEGVTVEDLAAAG